MNQCNPMKNDHCMYTKFVPFLLCAIKTYSSIVFAAREGLYNLKRLSGDIIAILSIVRDLGPFLRFEFCSLIKAFNLSFCFSSSDLSTVQTFAKIVQDHWRQDFLR